MLIYGRLMDLDRRLELRDILLGDEKHQLAVRELLRRGATSEPELDVLFTRIDPLLQQLLAAVNEFLPKATPEEAVEHVLGHTRTFTLTTILEYCGDVAVLDPEVEAKVQREISSRLEEGTVDVLEPAAERLIFVQRDPDAAPEDWA